MSEDDGDYDDCGDCGDAVDMCMSDLAEVEAERDKLREQLAHALRCPDPICETCRDLKRALATLPDAPVKEKP